MLATEARTEADLETAGDHFAKVIATFGLTTVLALVAWRARRTGQAKQSNQPPAPHDAVRDTPQHQAAEHAPLEHKDAHAPQVAQNARRIRPRRFRIAI